MLGGKRSGATLEQIKDKADSALRQMEAQIQHEAEAARALTARNRELEAVIRDLSSEKQNLLYAVEEVGIVVPWAL